MEDFSFQMFSPLRTPVKKKKKKKKNHDEEGPSQNSQPVVQSCIDAEKDSEGNGEMISQKRESPSKRKRKKSEGSASPTKKDRRDRKAGVHILSGSDGEVEAAPPQVVSPRARRMGLTSRAFSPELFSDLGSDHDTEPLGTFMVQLLSPAKKKAHSQEKLSAAPSSGSQRENVLNRNSDQSLSGSESGGDSQNSSQGKTPSKTLVRSKASSASSSSTSGPDSDSDSECETLIKAYIERNQSPVKSPHQKPSSESSTASRVETAKENDSSDSGSEAPRQLTKHVMRYTCPLGFKEVEFAESALKAEDVRESDEIWLVRVPTDYNISRLDRKVFPLDPVVQLGKSKGSDVEYELHRSKSKVHKTSLLLPSKEDNKLHHVGQVTGQMWLSECHNIPSAVMPKLKPPRETSLPAGLKYRHVAFGAGPLLTKPEVSTLRKKQKKKKRKSEEVHQENLIMETNDEVPEDFMQTQSGTKKKKKKKQKHD